MFFLNVTKGVNHWWLYLVGIVAVSLGYIIGQIPLSLILAYRTSVDPDLNASDLQNFTEDMDFARFGISTNAGLALSLLFFVFALAFLYFTVRFIHHRPFQSLISCTGRTDWKRFLWGFGVWFGISLVMEFISYMISPENYQFMMPDGKYILLLLICLLFLPLQTSFEELFFRGYLLQASGWFFKSKWVAFAFTSLLFMSIHLANPEIGKYGIWNMVIYYLFSGMVLAFITVMDDRLELAMGIHYANNFFGATLVTYEGAALQTDSLFKVHEIQPQFMVIGFAVVAILFSLIASRKYKWQSIGKSFSWNNHLHNN